MKTSRYYHDGQIAVEIAELYSLRADLDLSLSNADSTFVRFIVLDRLFQNCDNYFNSDRSKIEVLVSEFKKVCNDKNKPLTGVDHFLIGILRGKKPSTFLSATKLPFSETKMKRVILEVIDFLISVKILLLRQSYLNPLKNRLVEISKNQISTILLMDRLANLVISNYRQKKMVQNVTNS